MRRWTASIVVVVLLIALPLLGVRLAGKPIAPYLAFPPQPGQVAHEPFSWTAFVTLAALIVMSVAPLLLHVLVSNYRSAPGGCGSSPTTVPQPAFSTRRWLERFPWWGWAGLAWIGLWWILAWTRYPWTTSLQAHTFTPLWLGYILVVNAGTFARIGRCMMLHRPRYTLSLFPLSAGTWWLFEYLNRFVENWHYAEIANLSALDYAIRATLPFSTVLPAVIGTAELLTACPAVSAGLDRFRVVRLSETNAIGWSGLAVSCAGLAGLGVWPNAFFPFVWVAPLLLLLSLQLLDGRPTILSPLAQGDWRGLWVPAVAALTCGFFWELWNWRSLAHWEYAIPYVQGLRLFEMPLLGYSGYLPFGVTCVVAADFFLGRKFAGGAAYYGRGSDL